MHILETCCEHRLFHFVFIIKVLENLDLSYHSNMSVLTALSFVLCVVVCAASTAPPNVTINAWQYCYGCRETVNAYAKAAVTELHRLEKLPKKDKKVLDAAMVMDHLCDSAYFKSFGAFAKYSCIKVLDEHRVKFLEEFSGATSIPDLSSKKDVLDKKKKVQSSITHVICIMGSSC